MLVHSHACKVDDRGDCEGFATLTKGRSRAHNLIRVTRRRGSLWPSSSPSSLPSYYRRKSRLREVQRHDRVYSLNFCEENFSPNERRSTRGGDYSCEIVRSKVSLKNLECIPEPFFCRTRDESRNLSIRKCCSVSCHAFCIAFKVICTSYA